MTTTKNRKRKFARRGPRKTIQPVVDNIIDVSVGGQLLEDPADTAPASVDSNPVHAKYPPPKKGKEFSEKWRQIIGGVVSRSNFKMGHLYQLAILCDLYVEYGVLQKFIAAKGYTYEAIGRQGVILKPYPQVQLMMRVQGEIRNYSKMLGLLMAPDKSGESGGEDSEWA